MRRPASPEGAIRRLSVARFISWAGSQAANIALLALVYERSDGSGVWISAALLASLGARVVASPWAGSLGDYFDRRVVMVGSDLVAAGCFVAISQVGSLPMLVAFAGLAGVAEAPFGPASGALVAMLVPAERRGWANGMLSIGVAAGMVLGAAFGGILVATLGASTAFLVNAGSFVVSAVLALSIGGHFVSGAREDVEQRGVLRGVRFLFETRMLRLTALGTALVALALGMVNVAELPYFLDIGAGKAGYGIAVAAWAAGQIVGGRLAAKIDDARRERLALIAGCAAISMVIVTTGAVPLFAAVALLFVAGGLGNALLNLGFVLIVQRWTPHAIQGRTLAAAEALVNAALGVSLIAGGLLLSSLTPRGVFVLGGVLGCAAVAVTMRTPRHPMPERPEEQPAGAETEDPTSARRLPLTQPAVLPI
jgi:MFS family permease